MQDAIAQIRELHAAAALYFETNDKPGAWLDADGSWKDWESESEGSAAEARRDALAEALALLDAEPSVMSITFTGEAFETFRAAVTRMILSLPGSARYFTQITPAEGEPFDAWLIGVDYDAEMGDTIKIVRNDDNGSTGPELGIVESVRADRIHVY